MINFSMVSFSHNFSSESCNEPLERKLSLKTP